MNPHDREEANKWLRLGYETFGQAGLAAMAKAMGLAHATDRSAVDDGDVDGDVVAAAVRPAGGATPQAPAFSPRQQMDDQTSPNHRIVEIDAEGRPRAEVFSWRPVGKGSSSFGHMSASIGNRMYSWGPSGMDVEPRSDYLRRNSFRPALSRDLDLPMNEIVEFDQSLQRYPLQHEYGTFLANCADPVEEGLENLGYPMGVRLTPKDVMDGIVFAKLSPANDYRLYKADPSAQKKAGGAVERAWDKLPSPWSWFFE